jgi:CubicO group peptidase (beta-lactamase class C family)
MPVRIALFVCLCCVLGPRAGFAQASDRTETAGTRQMTPADIQSLVRPLVLGQLERRRIAGAVVIVVKDGAVLFSEGYGHAGVSSRRPMGPETLVRIASITKTLTALAVMQLVQSGRLDLDRDVNDYLDFAVPALPGRAPV